MKKSILRSLAAACIVAAGFGFMAVLFSAVLSDKAATERDFIQYWAAGRQLIQGGNPYDIAAILRLERAAGLDADKAMVSFSPPVALILAFPLGLVNPKTGLTIWLLCLIASLAMSIWLLWALNGNPDSRMHLLAFLYAPALVCLTAGQLGDFFLLGVVLFLYLHNSRPFLAGAALMPCALKPHLFLPFALVLLLWAVSRKEYRILAGFFAALLVSCSLSLCLDLHAWSQYSQMMNVARPMNLFVPTLSMVFRLFVDRNALWLQFLPDAACCCWAAWYFWSRRTQWSWLDHGLLVLLASVACASYALFTDEAVLLPAVLTGLYRASNGRRSLLPLGLIAGVALIEGLRSVPITSAYYMWTSPAWLAWYLYATARLGVGSKRIHGISRIPA
jgi:Glycosyltransferase family 87